MKFDRTNARVVVENRRARQFIDTWDKLEPREALMQSTVSTYVVLATRYQFRDRRPDFGPRKGPLYFDWSLATL